MQSNHSSRIQLAVSEEIASDRLDLFVVASSRRHLCELGNCRVAVCDRQAVVRKIGYEDRQSSLDRAAAVELGLGEQPAPKTPLAMPAIVSTIPRVNTIRSTSASVSSRPGPGAGRRQSALPDETRS